jgi:hypothetical protein
MLRSFGDININKYNYYGSFFGVDELFLAVESIKLISSGSLP